MDDFLLMLEPLLNGVSFQVFVQIPHNKHSNTIAKALAYDGLWSLFQGKAREISLEECKVKGRDKKNYFGLVAVKGITQNGLPINDLEIYIQLPRFKDGQEQEIAEGIVHRGLGYTVFCKKVHVKSAGETIPQAHENERIVLA